MIKTHTIQIRMYNMWIDLISFTDRDDANKFIDKYNVLFEDETYRIVRDTVYTSLKEAEVELKDILDGIEEIITQ